MEANYFTVLYWFCHTSTWIRHGCTRVPNPEPPSHLPPQTILLGHPSAPAPSFLYPASCILHRTWTGDSFLIWYYTCFNAILRNHPTLSLSHRVQKTVLYTSVFVFKRTTLSEYEESWNSSQFRILVYNNHICGTGWYLTYPYEMEKLSFLFFRKPGKSPFKSPLPTPVPRRHHRLCWRCNPSYLKRSTSLWIRIMFLLWFEIFPLWCSQLFLIFMVWCFSLLQIQSMCSPVTRTRRMPYILWTVNKSINWLLCSQNSVTTGISQHSNLDFFLKMSLF